jgi:hypothetical protein
MNHWLPEGVPGRVSIASLGVEFVALSPALLDEDYAAVMRDIEMLRTWSAQDWPTETFTKQENLVDLERHDREQRDRVALTYSVLVEQQVVGCIYVRSFVDALTSRDVTPPVEHDIPFADAVARGWAHDIEADHLLTATRLLLMLPPFEFSRIWWQTNSRCSDQLDACDHSGMVESMSFEGQGEGQGTTWILRSVPK